jgi:putative hemolysin
MKDKITRSSLGLIACVVVGTLGLSACGSDDNESPLTTTPVSEAPADDPPTTDDVGMANPASVYCEEQGGTVEIVDEADGQVGYCNLPDGQRIEEWEYYRANQ